MAGSRLLYIVILIISYSPSWAQVNQYFVSFKDKTGTPYSITEPEKFLSGRSIARRQKEGISIVEEDLPVNPLYVQQVMSTGAKVFFSSRWWNGVLIEAGSDVISTVNALPFVSGSQFVAPGKKLTGGRVNVPLENNTSNADQPVNQIQLQQIGLDEMHDKGFRGEGIWIGVIDSGFLGVDQTEPFSHLFTENRVKQTFNFVANDINVFQHHDHGTKVLSVMAANSTGIYTGGVSEAEYLLYVTEDVSSEYRVEEFNWTIAAERADSAGVDVINSSLGYSVFDDPSMDYSKTDLNGKMAVITRAARKAIEKGIIVVTSAGNEGGNSWQLITTPADAEGILAVGSIDSQGLLSPFSSRGPTSDNRIKPEVVAMGSGTSVILSNGMTANASGTSLSSPLLASLAAGVLQAYPEHKASQVYEAIINSSHQASRPDNLMGYGIPHFRAVVNYLDRSAEADNVSIYPNPVTGTSFHIKLKTLSDSPVEIMIFDSQGKRAEMFSHTITWINNPLEYDLSNLQPGLYLIRIKAGAEMTTLKFVKL